MLRPGLDIVELPSRRKRRADDARGPVQAVARVDGLRLHMLLRTLDLLGRDAVLEYLLDLPFDGAFDIGNGDAMSRGRANAEGRKIERARAIGSADGKRDILIEDEVAIEPGRRTAAEHLRQHFERIGVLRLASRMTGCEIGSAPAWLADPWALPDGPRRGGLWRFLRAMAPPPRAPPDRSVILLRKPSRAVQPDVAAEHQHRIVRRVPGAI